MRPTRRFARSSLGCASICARRSAASGDRAVSRDWSNRRVILFTEYGDTKRYLLDLLRGRRRHRPCRGAHLRASHGGIGDDAREDVQRAFNAPPDVDTRCASWSLPTPRAKASTFRPTAPTSSTSICLGIRRVSSNATAASTARCSPSREVRCHYFVYPARPEDRVLETLVRKIDIVQRELGSLGGVLLEEMEEILAGGLGKGTADRLEIVGKDRSTRNVEDELEEARKDEKVLREEIVRAGRRYDMSRRALEVSPDALRRVVNIGLRLAGTSGLIEDGTVNEKPRFRLPELDRSWDVTLDTLRPPRPRDESFYDWRKRPPLPVTFSPIARLTGALEQLHLAHPFTKRILDRFLAQGFSAHDLRRVTAVIDPEAGEAYAIVYARLTLFGPGAARLHDEIVAVAAPWDGSVEGAGSLTLRADRETTAALVKSTEARLAAGAPAPTGRNAAAIASSADALMAGLWPALEDEADAHAVAAKNGLAARARTEADGMRALLERQRRAIQKTLRSVAQRDLFEGLGDSADLREQQRQLALDLEHMDRRDKAIAVNIEREPAAIEALYDVRITRLTPVGVVVSWPRSWT